MDLNIGFKMLRNIDQMTAEEAQLAQVLLTTLEALHDHGFKEIERGQFLELLGCESDDTPDDEIICLTEQYWKERDIIWGILKARVAKPQ